MRLFFALELPGKLALQIDEWRHQHLPPTGRPVPAENFHITLAFLGDLNEQRLEQLCPETDNLLEQREFTGSELVLDEVGYWPKPGIFWLGPSQWPQSLNTLAGALANRGNAVGSKRKRGDYRPHVTLCRACHEPPPAPTQLCSFSLGYSGFALMESRNSRRGVSYNSIAQWQFTPRNGC